MTFEEFIELPYDETDRKLKDIWGLEYLEYMYRVVNAKEEKL